jgi:hypothetical protein
MRSHTVDSLSRELSGVFDVQECLYEEHDPRYLISVVKRKSRFSDSPPASEHDNNENWTKQEFPRDGVFIEDALCAIHAICDLLELHKERVERFFLNAEVSEGRSPLSLVDTDLPRLIELLEHTYEMRAFRA